MGWTLAVCPVGHATDVDDEKIADDNTVPCPICGRVIPLKPSTESIDVRQPIFRYPEDDDDDESSL